MRFHAPLFAYFLLIILLSQQAGASLSCNTRSGSCNADETCLLSLAAPNDTHAAQCGYFDYSLCCNVKSATIRGSASARVNCAPGEEGIIALYANTDAHAELYTNGGYNYTLCVTPEISCAKKTSCVANETAVLSLFGDTDSHVGSANYYSSNICCFDQPPVVGEIRTYNASMYATNSFTRTQTVVIRANVTDVSGSGDISAVLITIKDSSANIIVSGAQMNIIGAIANGGTYGYNYTLTEYSAINWWNITVWANDTFGNSGENVSSFNVSKTSGLGLWVVNSAMSVLFSPIGISSIIFSGIDVLGNETDFATSGTPAITMLPTVANIAYPKGVFLKIYSALSKIVVSSNHSFNPVLYLRPNFSSFYNGTANTFSGSGQQFNSIQNMTDVYSASNGVAIIGRNMNVSVSNTAYKEIRLYNITGFEIYVHSGDYANVLPEVNRYMNPPSYLVSVPSQIIGISVDELSDLAALPYASIRKSISGSSNFNLEVEGTNVSIGKTIPSDRDVKVVRYPAAIIGRSGNVTETYIRVATWLGSDYT